jgi:hypothetical protein
MPPASPLSLLSNLKALVHLGLEGTAVSDVSSLFGLTALRYLDLSGTRVAGVSMLPLIPNLRPPGVPHASPSA